MTGAELNENTNVVLVLILDACYRNLYPSSTYRTADEKLLCFRHIPSPDGIFLVFVFIRIVRCLVNVVYLHLRIYRLLLWQKQARSEIWEMQLHTVNEHTYQSSYRCCHSQSPYSISLGHVNNTH